MTGAKPDPSDLEEAPPPVDGVYEMGRALVVLQDERAPVDERIAALTQLRTAPISLSALHAVVLDIIADAARPAALRIAALPFAKTALFRPESMRVLRPVYLTALRAAAESDDETLRMRALGMLAREQDKWALDRIVAGLVDPAQARIPAAKAIQLLSYQVKSDIHPVLRTYALDRAPAHRDARNEALRVIAADPTSRELFERIACDKSEPADVRRIAASGLHSLDRSAARTVAKQIVLDDDDDDDVRAASFTLLAQDGEDEDDVRQQAEVLREREDGVGRSANAYLRRQRR